MEELWQRWCSEFVSEAECERDVLRLFKEQSGAWTDLASFESIQNIPPQVVFVTWLPSPHEDSVGFRVIVFLESEFGGSQIAFYNLYRLQRKFENG